MGECENVWARDKESKFKQEVDKGYWSIKNAIWYLFEYSDAYTENQITRLCVFIYVWENKEKKQFYLERPLLEGDDLAIKDYMRIEDNFKSWFGADIQAGASVIAPYDFISWAMERETIDVPVVMAEWKQKQDALAAGAKIETRGRPKERLPDAAGKIIAALLASSGHKPDGRNTTSYVKSQINQIGLDAKPSTIKKQLQQTQAIIEKENAKK